MGKTPERRVFTSASSSEDIKQQQLKPQHQQLKPQLYADSNRSRSSRSPSARRFRPKPRQSKQQQQPALLKQLLWKAKAVQPTPPLLTLTQQQQRSRDQEEVEALAATKNKAVAVAALPSSESFVAESSSQETQSGSDDEAVFLPYSDLLPAVQPPTEWQVFKEQENGAEETDGEENSSPVVPSETVETPTTEQQEEQPEQDELEKAAAIRRKRQRSKLKQRQKRAAKEQKRFQHQQKQVHEGEKERVRPAEEDAGSTQSDGSAAVAIFHPPTNLASEMDAGVCRAVLSQLKEVVPCIVVGDVACPMVPDEQSPVSSGEAGKGGTSGSEEAIVDFRQHVIAMLDRSKETQIQYRESFVLENSGFDAASSYDFFKSRFCEIQRSTDIVYFGVLATATYKAIAATLPTIMKVTVLEPSTLFPPPLSPPLVGDRLPSADRGLALLLLSSVMGDSCKTPFDEVESVGNGVRPSISSDPDEDEAEDDDERIEPELESAGATLLLPELPRLLTAEAEEESDAGEELDVDPVDPSNADPESEALVDEISEDDPALSPPSEPDEDPGTIGVLVGAVSLDPDSDGGVAVTGVGLIGVDAGVSVGVGDVLPESEPDSDEGIAVTGGGLVGLGLGVDVDPMLDPELELDSDDGIAVTGGGLVGPEDPLDDSDEDTVTTGASVVATGAAVPVGVGAAITGVSVVTTRPGVVATGLLP
ncbi:hypothetical protein GQ600_11823 [Phytophthora cactorum]|nr:hypothetical protein GQ600_11823 [Phytophthora cactorum]